MPVLNASDLKEHKIFSSHFTQEVNQKLMIRLVSLTILILTQRKYRCNQQIKKKVSHKIKLTQKTVAAITKITIICFIHTLLKKFSNQLKISKKQILKRKYKAKNG
jgi:hypothetical protein